MFSYFSRLAEPRLHGSDAIEQVHGPDETDQMSSRSGILASTLVATMRGWCRIGDLVAGDKVLTFDAGLQTVTHIIKEPLYMGNDCPKSFWPIEVPAGAMGNRRMLQLMPNQSIMVESDMAEDRYGDPFSLIPSTALLGVDGVERVPPGDNFDVVHLHFSTDQVIFGENGTLYLCPASRDMLDILLMDGENDPMYSILPVREARLVVKSLDTQGAVTGFDLPPGLLDAAYA